MDTKKWRRWILIPIGVIIMVLGAYFGPILLEATPPMLEITGVDTGKTYRGGITLNVSVHDERPGLASLTVQIDDNSLEPLALVEVQDGRTFWALDTASLADGKHLVSVIATDRSLRKNATQQHLTFFTDNTPPQLQVPSESRRVGQGRTFALFVQSSEPVAELTGKLFNREIALYPVESDAMYRSLIGVSVTHPTKMHSLFLKAVDLVGNMTEQTLQIEVVNTVFQQGSYIVLSPEKQKVMMDKSKSREDNAKRGRAYMQATKENTQLWEGKFLRPAEGRLTSPFGKYREYNTGVRRHHLGTDIANDVGTPVYAGNHGIVTLADKLHIYGNAVVINHGQGISTSYNHLSEIRVTAEERVDKAQLIGLMGATGQVTGPHLHWGMVVNGIAVAPEEWTEKDFSLP